MKMKLFAALLIGFLASCSKDESPKPSPYGVWAESTAIFNVYKDSITWYYPKTKGYGSHKFKMIDDKYIMFDGDVITYDLTFTHFAFSNFILVK